MEFFMKAREHPDQGSGGLHVLDGGALLQAGLGAREGGADFGADRVDGGDDGDADHGGDQAVLDGRSARLALHELGKGLHVYNSQLDSVARHLFFRVPTTRLCPSGLDKTEITLGPSTTR